MAEPNGALVSLYAQRNNAIKNKGDVAGLNAKIKNFVEKNNISQSVRRASSVAASNVQSNNRGADVKKKNKKVPVITIGIGMAEFPKGKNKPHNYFAGGSVKMNPGLKALKKASPEAFKKITKS